MSEQLHLFYGYWQIAICSFAFLALFSIWQHITKGNDQGQRDLGLFWLSVAILVWALSGALEVYYAAGLADPNFDSTQYEGLKSMLSIFNSAFILLALPRFRHVPKVIRPVVRSESWRWLVISTFGFSIVLTLLMLSGVIIPKRITLISSVDLIYAIFTLFFLGLTLWASFERRGLTILAYLAGISIAFTLAAQVLKLGDSDFLKILLNTTFKTILIVLFFALALSWVEELGKSARSILSTRNLAIQFSTGRNHQNRREYIVHLQLPEAQDWERIYFTAKPFLLLHRFAEKRKTEGIDGGWLEIQPKTAVKKDYDIKDYNEIGRILDTICSHMSKSDSLPTISKGDLKEILFEYGKSRRIRLRVQAEHIELTSHTLPVSS
ncbi:MAG: hypothetical protein KTR30_19320 [Saprospiraceae bacterium]|nr:hypothetical protein [Saprospiraceae bacterium]